jgi:NitT/TauT family transport system substrate-binding protein
MVRNEPETIKKMIVALREGWRAYLDDPAAANAVMAKLNREMDARTFAESAAIQAPLIETAETQATALGDMTSARWQDLAKQLVDLDVIKTAGAAEEAFISINRLPGGAAAAPAAGSAAAPAGSASAPAGSASAPAAPR